MRKVLVRRFIGIPAAQNAEIPFELPEGAEHVSVTLYNDEMVVLQYVLDEPKGAKPKPKAAPVKKRVKQLA